MHGTKALYAFALELVETWRDDPLFFETLTQQFGQIMNLDSPAPAPLVTNPVPTTSISRSSLHKKAMESVVPMSELRGSQISPTSAAGGLLLAPTPSSLGSPSSPATPQPRTSSQSLPTRVTDSSSPHEPGLSDTVMVPLEPLAPAPGSAAADRFCKLMGTLYPQRPSDPQLIITLSQGEFFRATLISLAHCLLQIAPSLL